MSAMIKWTGQAAAAVSLARMLCPNTGRPNVANNTAHHYIFVTAQSTPPEGPRWDEMARHLLCDLPAQVAAWWKRPARRMLAKLGLNQRSRVSQLDAESCPHPNLPARIMDYVPRHDSNMMTANLLAVTVAMLSFALVTAAHAGEGDGEPFPSRITGSVFASVPTRDTGSERAFDLAFTYATVAVGAGNILPTSGSESAVQSSNSLPRRTLNIALVYAQAGSVRRDQMQAASPARMALVPGGKPGG